MAISEQQLRDILQARNFFAAAHSSYRRLIDFDQEEIDRLRLKKRHSKADRELFALWDDSPPYPNLAKEILPSLMYLAERWEQMTDPEMFNPPPFLRMLSGGCENPKHYEKVGFYYPFKHPFWKIWYPPNSFPCTCSVTSLSLFDIEQYKQRSDGWRCEPGPPLSSFEFPRPDEGFDFNVGMLMQKAVSKIQPAPQALESPAATIKKPQGFFSRLFSWDK